MNFNYFKPAFAIAILCIVNHAAGQRYSQPEYKELIKKYKVNKVFTYLFKGRDDSTLSMLDVYNRSGNLVSTKKFDASLKVISTDTLIYNDAGHLTKRIMTDKQGKDEYFYINDDKGKLLSMHAILRDSTKMFSYSYFDQKAHLTKTVMIMESRIGIDTTTTTLFYDKLDRLIKLATQSKSNGQSQVLFIYGKDGKLRKRIISDSVSKSTAKHKYDSKGNNTETENSFVYKNRTDLTLSKQSYFNNRFPSEFFLYKDKKSILWEKYYYETF